MGNLLQYYQKSKTLKLCDDMLDESSDFIILIHIYTMQKFTDQNIVDTLEYLQYMRPYISYMRNNVVHLIFKPSSKLPFIRSNILGELISYISSELSIWMVQNLQKDPRLVSVSIYTNKFNVLLDELCETIKSDRYVGKVYGIDNLTEEKLNELYK